MERWLTSIVAGLIVTFTGPGLAGAQTQVTSMAHQSNASNEAIHATLAVYLAAFDVGNLPKAYSMFADIKSHVSLAKWTAQGDPQKGWRPIIERIRVFQKGNAALAYTTLSVFHVKDHQRRNIIFVFPLIRKNDRWRMVFDENDFGHQMSIAFKELSKEANAYRP